MTPGVLGTMDPAGMDSLRVVVVAGESFAPELVRRWALEGGGSSTGTDRPRPTILAS